MMESTLRGAFLVFIGFENVVIYIETQDIQKTSRVTRRLAKRVTIQLINKNNPHFLKIPLMDKLKYSLNSQKAASLT